MRHLDSPESLASLERVCRTCHLEVSPSVINVIEATKAKNPALRLRLLTAIQSWAGLQPLLPWPPEILIRSALAFLEGQRAFTIPRQELLWLSLSPHDLPPDQIKAHEFASSIESVFQDIHQRHRKEGQTIARRDRLEREWPTPATFLDFQRCNTEILEYSASALWDALSLPGSPPPGLVETVEPWGLVFDALNFAFYDRIIQLEQTRNAAGYMDLLQLVYLSRHQRARILVTNDVSFAEAAKAILDGRYPNCRVLSAEALLGLDAVTIAPGGRESPSALAAESPRAAC